MAQPDPSIIQRSRIGYSYQYKYALWKILKYLETGDIEAAFVDYPFGIKGYSLDLRVDLNSGPECHIYEVKTGEYFVNDKVAAISKTLKSCMQFRKDLDPGTRLITEITITQVGQGIVDNWSDILWIKEGRPRRRNNNGETAAMVADRCFKTYKMSSDGFAKREFVDFIKETRIQIAPDYTDIDDLICGRISQISKGLETDSSAIEIPDSSIMLELLDCISKAAEDGLNNIPGLVVAMIDAFSRRALIVEHANYPGSGKETLLRAQREIVEEKIRSKTGISIETRDMLVLGE